MIRKLVVVGSSLALAGAWAVGSAGVADAAKPKLQGTLTCAASSTTQIKPGIVLSTSQLPKGKDKKPKLTTNGTGSGCTGTTVPGSGTTPSSYTLTGKAKATSRVLIQPAGSCPTVGRSSKSKITFNTGDKVKVTLVAELANYAYNPSTQVSTPFPACGSGTDAALAFAAGHLNDRIETRSQGTSGGKAYAGKLVKLRSITTETLLGQVAAAQTPTGVTALHADPAHSKLTIG